MSATEDAKNVSSFIRQLGDKMIAAAYGLAREYATRAIQDFRTRQGIEQEAVGEFWTNRTTDAVRRVFTQAFLTGTEVGFLIAHAVDYGISLELANDRKHEALRPIIEKWGALYITAVTGRIRKLTGG